MKTNLTAGILLIAFAAGCGGTKLETGYKPRKLNDSDAERRGYYAAPFSPEARAAEAERAVEHDTPGRMMSP